MPNVASKYIQWCRERGIEVPGGEVQRVTVPLPADITLSNWENPILKALPFLDKTLVATFSEAEDFGYNLKPNVTAEIILEMKI